MWSWYWLVAAVFVVSAPASAASADAGIIELPFAAGTSSLPSVSEARRPFTSQEPSGSSEGVVSPSETQSQTAHAKKPRVWGFDVALGGHYWRACDVPLVTACRNTHELLSLTLGVGANIAGIYLGLRAGIADSFELDYGPLRPLYVGLPLEAEVRTSGEGAYAAATTGVWLLFPADSADGRVVPSGARLRGAVGAGYGTGIFSVGAELGWMHPSLSLGIRLSIHPLR